MRRQPESHTPNPERPNQPALTQAEGEALLSLARLTLERAVLHGDFNRPDLDDVPARLREPDAAFVTLTVSGELHGCIGSVQARRPLALDVTENALSAAFNDPRFPALGPDDLPGLSIEISILTPLQPLVYTSPSHLVGLLRPGVDGVLITRGRQRGLLLPQVWERIPDPVEFMAQLCLKAGLAADAYLKTRLDVFVFQIQSFEESVDHESGS